MPARRDVQLSDFLVHVARLGLPDGAAATSSSGTVARSGTPNRSDRLAPPAAKLVPRDPAPRWDPFTAAPDRSPQAGVEPTHDLSSAMSDLADAGGPPAP